MRAIDFGQFMECAPRADGRHARNATEVMVLQQNVGILDRIGRAFLAVFLLHLAWKKQGKLGVVAALNAGMILSSVASGYCPLYKLMKVNTVGKPI